MPPARKLPTGADISLPAHDAATAGIRDYAEVVPAEAG